MAATCWCLVGRLVVVRRGTTTGLRRHITVIISCPCTTSSPRCCRLPPSDTRRLIAPASPTERWAPVPPAAAQTCNRRFFGVFIAKFHYTDPTRTGPDTDKVRARCRVRAKFHYTDPTRTRTDPTEFRGKKVPAGPCGSGRVRVGSV